MLKILSENLKIIMVGAISILMIIAAAIVISLYFGGNVGRQLVVTDIKGSVYISRDGKRVGANKNSRLKSGDVVTTAKDASLRISMDGDKSVWVEPDTSVYIYYTDVASKGDISVNLTKGAVICQLNDKLKKNATFSLKTPNSSVSVKGTVFRAEFGYEEEYKDYKNVMITQVQNLEGSVSLQLYDAQKQPFELPMVLIERTAAQMITAEDMCEYGYLNYSFDLLSLSDLTLGEMIQIRTETELAFSPEELNRAYKTARDMRLEQEAATETSDSEPISETSSETVAKTSETTSRTAETTVPEQSETEEPSSYGTLRTTQQTHEYTTYSGIKWWEMTGNTNTGTDDYEDWFSDEETVFGEETTATVGTSAAANQ